MVQGNWPAFEARDDWFKQTPVSHWHGWNNLYSQCLGHSSSWRWRFSNKPNPVIIGFLWQPWKCATKVSCFGEHNWQMAVAADLWIHHHIWAKVMLPSGSSQTVAEHGKNTKVGPFLWDGLPRCPSGKESACQWRRHKRRRFDPWTGKWRRKWQPTPVSLSGSFHEQRSLVDYSS